MIPIMKNTKLKIGFIAFTVLLLSACNTNKTEQEAVVIDKEQIKQEIQAKENLFAETYNAGEMKNIGYYADDAVSFSQNRPPLVGKQQIVNFLAEGINSFAKENKISFKTEEVFVSSDGNQVVEIGYFKLVDSTDTVINSGNYMSLFEKRNGKYVSVRDMSTSDIDFN
jgi:ketosteroid isomerase-like protein